MWKADFMMNALYRASGNAPKKMIHVMPWFRKDGLHWRHVDRFSMIPEKGVYNSDDKGILQQQVSEMKSVGIEGMIIDWYGVQKRNDYFNPNHINTMSLIEECKRNQLYFTVCYEARTLTDGNHIIDKDLVIKRIEEDMQYIQNEIKSGYFLHFQGKPVVLIWSPEYNDHDRHFINDRVRRELGDVFLLNLYHFASPNVDGYFSWIPNHWSKNSIRRVRIY